MNNALIALLFSSLVSGQILIILRSDSIVLAVEYLAYGLLNFFLVKHYLRKDILSPIGAMVAFIFIGYGVAFPFYAGNQRLDYLSISDQILEQTLFITILACIFFVIGFRTKCPIFLPLYKIFYTKNVQKELSIPFILLVYVVIIVAGYLRYVLRLGVAGETSTVVMSGILQYILFDWVSLCAVYVLVMSLRKQGRLWILWGLGCLGIITLTQAFLGWRGGIVSSFFMALVVFYYQERSGLQSRDGSFVSPRKITWMALLVGLAVIIIPFANSMRISRIGGETITGIGDALKMFWIRGFGLSRFARLIEFDRQVFFWNDRGIDLFFSGITSFKYADWTIWGLGVGVADGRGASGVGSPYLCFGIVGVVFAFFAFGYFSRMIYELLVNCGWPDGGVWITVFYAKLMAQYSFCFKEIFSFTIFSKWLFANLVGIYVLKHIFSWRLKKNINLK